MKHPCLDKYRFGRHESSLSKYLWSGLAIALALGAVQAYRYWGKCAVCGKLWPALRGCSCKKPEVPTEAA